MKILLEVDNAIMYDGTAQTTKKIEKLLQPFKKQVFAYKSRLLINNVPMTNKDGWAVTTKGNLVRIFQDKKGIYRGLI